MAANSLIHPVKVAASLFEVGFLPTKISKRCSAEKTVPRFAFCDDHEACSWGSFKLA